MVESRRRTSLLGGVALIAGLIAVVLTRFNPTGIETVRLGPWLIRLATVVAVGACGLAMLAFLATSSSKRTSTGLPLLALMVCSGALLLDFKPRLFDHRRSPTPPAPAHIATPPPAPSPAVSSRTNEQRAKTIFDFDSSTAPAVPQVQRADSPPGKAVDAGAAPASGARPDKAAAIHAARAKRNEARDRVVASLQSTAAYQSAKDNADETDAELKKARLVYEPGSPQLIAISRAALAARDKLQALISDACIRDDSYREATRELKAAGSDQ